MNRSPTVINFAVRDRAGDTLIETDFPRFSAQRIIRRAQIRRMDGDYAARREQAARIVAAMERSEPRRQMATPRPMATRTPARVNATRGAIMVAAALAVAAMVLWVAA